ncbi:hypothetical protein SAMN05216557_105206 [Sphingomonas carotinifaciens]|uniref:Uncharacterized protein n=1 Tax=Sphingomonas carotinifaciens TaxID=1166323 RepID=A0A1G7NLA0_9SPHN|nr:hypothetical protein SAMN05216557_105206 [Sphingomonas carotinifaciens]
MNSAPRCSAHAGGMGDLMLEGPRGASRGEGEGPPQTPPLLGTPSPSHRFATGPSLSPQGRGRYAQTTRTPGMPPRPRSITSVIAHTIASARSGERPGPA